VGLSLFCSPTYCFQKQTPNNQSNYSPFKEERMAHRTRLAAFISLIILTMLLGVSVAAAQKSGRITPDSSSSAGAGVSWWPQYIQQVDYPNNVGAYVSLAINPLDNLPHVSYYDGYNGDLMYAHYVGKGLGNCGTGNNWHCESIDTAGNVGTATSIDIWQVDDTHYRVGISYHDIDNGALKFISWTCGQLTCTIKNDVVVADATLALVDIGRYSSLKFGTDGTPLIAFYRNSSLGNDSLMTATYTGGAENCGGDDGWSCTVIDNGDQVGQYVSLDRTYDGSPYLAYYVASTGDLKVAYYLGIADPDCYADNGWYCPVIDSAGDVGKFASITAQHMVGDQIFRIAYYDATNHHLKYYDPGFGTPFVVDEMGTSTSPMGISMDVDINGFPIIAYQQILTEFSQPELHVARPYQAYDDGNFGNCGDIPPGYLFLFWRCIVADHAGQYLEEAEYVSINTSGGAPKIAYSEFLSIDVGDNAMSLKYLSERVQLFLPLLVNK
jgi:hypothetical protein